MYYVDWPLSTVFVFKWEWHGACMYVCMCMCVEVIFLYHCEVVLVKF